MTLNTNVAMTANAARAAGTTAEGDAIFNCANSGDVAPAPTRSASKNQGSGGKLWRCAMRPHSKPSRKCVSQAAMATLWRKNKKTS